jgi:ankyrin repeat protein
MEEKIVMKGLKSYLTGKKYYETDADKSFEYFKQCIMILNDIKEKNIKVPDNISNLLDETETECSKYLTMSIESTIEKPIIKKYNGNNICSNANNNILFEIIETGTINKMKEYKYGEVDFTIYDNNGNTPLHMAVNYGDTAFLKRAFILGARIDITNKTGHTIFETACLAHDPNMMNFLLLYGADMRKHLRFREGSKFHSTCDMIDTMLLEKMILSNNNNEKDIEYLDWVTKYININDILDIQLQQSSIKLTNMNLILKLDNMISTFPEEKRNTFISILKEELEYELHFKLGCPHNMIELILYNLVPFLPDYNDNLRYDWLICLEIKYLILKILKNKQKINTKKLKDELKDLLYESYIKNMIIPDGMIQTLTLQWINKIKV